MKKLFVVGMLLSSFGAQAVNDMNFSCKAELKRTGLLGDKSNDVSGWKATKKEKEALAKLKTSVEKINVNVAIGDTKKIKLNIFRAIPVLQESRDTKDLKYTNSYDILMFESGTKNFNGGDSVKISALNMGQSFDLSFTHRVNGGYFFQTDAVPTSFNYAATTISNRFEFSDNRSIFKSKNRVKKKEEKYAMILKCKVSKNAEVVNTDRATDGDDLSDVILNNVKENEPQQINRVLIEE